MKTHRSVLPPRHRSTGSGRDPRRVRGSSVQGERRMRREPATRVSNNEGGRSRPEKTARSKSLLERSCRRRGGSGRVRAPRPGSLASFDPRHFFHFAEAIRGRVGDVVCKTYGRGRGRKIILTRVPCFDGYVPTAAQRSRRDRMREATAFAQRVHAAAAARAFYTAAAKKIGRQPFRLAISDFLRGHERLREPIIAALHSARKIEQQATKAMKKGCVVGCGVREPAGLRVGRDRWARRECLGDAHLFRRARRSRYIQSVTIACPILGGPASVRAADDTEPFQQAQGPEPAEGVVPPGMRNYLRRRVCLFDG